MFKLITKLGGIAAFLFAVWVMAVFVASVFGHSDND